MGALRAHRADAGRADGQPRLGAAEAAQDLGAKPHQIFWKVTLPNILPGMMGGWLLAFTLSFDDFLISFFTSGAGLTTLPLKIYSLMRIGDDL